MSEASFSRNDMRSVRTLNNSTKAGGGDKREAISRAAIRVFAHNGYFNSKVADIAREAGVADGTVYLTSKAKRKSCTQSSIAALTTRSPRRARR